MIFSHHILDEISIFFFLDGAHRFPFPIIDWFFGAILLKENGLMVVDDTDIISCHILCKFMLDDSHWEPVEVKENYGIFRKLGGHDYPSDWQGQTFSSNKIQDDLSRFLSDMALETKNLALFESTAFQRRYLNEYPAKAALLRIRCITHNTIAKPVSDEPFERYGKVFLIRNHPRTKWKRQY